MCVLLRLLLSSRLQTLQQHHHPDVSKAAALISSPLLQQEDDISERLETTNFQVSLLGAFQDLPEASRTAITCCCCCSPQLMEQELKQTGLKKVPLEFEAAVHLLQGGAAAGGGGGVLGQHFCC